MNYIQKNLRPNEEIVISAKINAVAYVPTFFLAAIVLIAGIIVQLEQRDSLPPILVFAIFFCAALIIVRVIKLKSIELAVTNKKVIGKYGVFYTKSMDAFLNKVDNISVSKDLLGTIFHYYTIQINTTSGMYRFPFISNAEEFKAATMDNIEKYEYDRMNVQSQLIAHYIGGKEMPKQPAAQPAYSNNQYRTPQQPYNHQQNVNNNSSIVCPSCGRANVDNAAFCRSCGTRLK